MKKSKFNNLIDLIKAQSGAIRGMATEISKLEEQIELNLNNILKHKKEIAYIRKKMGDN